MIRRHITLALVALGLTVTAACGGGTDRPTATELSNSLTSKNNVVGATIPKKQADCFSKLLVKSAVSDKTLQALVDGDKKYKGTDKDRKALQAVANKAGTACV